MNINQAIHILTEHNKWRRGEPPYEFGGAESAHTSKELSEAVDFAIAELDKLQSTIEHLMRCKEFESKLQREILAVGGPLLNAVDGKTYCAQQAWWAIQEKLKNE